MQVGVQRALLHLQRMVHFAEIESARLGFLRAEEVQASEHHGVQ